MLGMPHAVAWITYFTMAGFKEDEVGRFLLWRSVGGLFLVCMFTSCSCPCLGCGSAVREKL
jgi:hypothetical protein